MAKRKRAKRVAPPKRGAERPRRTGRVAWLAVAVLAALGAFLLAKQQAQAPSEQVAPPATGLPHTPDYHSLLVDPADPERVLLGTHVGLYETVDGGRSWKTAGLEGKDAMNLVRTDEETVWAAGHEVLAKSADGGRTWSDVLPDGLPGLDVHGFAADPGDRRRLYAAIAGQGLFRSTDGGRSFELVTKEVGPAVFGLALTPNGRILAADPKRGLMASDDGGKTWRLALREGVVGVAVNPAAPKRLLATGSGILLSTDGGRSWREVQPIVDGAGPVAWSPSDPNVGYVVGFDRQLYRTGDAGASWQTVS